MARHFGLKQRELPKRQPPADAPVRGKEETLPKMMAQMAASILDRVIAKATRGTVGQNSAPRTFDSLGKD